MSSPYQSINQLNKDYNHLITDYLNKDTSKYDADCQTIMNDLTAVNKDPNVPDIVKYSANISMASIPN